MNIKIYIVIKSLNIKLLSLYSLYINNILKNLNVSFKLFHKPNKIKRITLLKSPHVYKKHKEQFSVVTYSIVYSLEGIPLETFWLNFILQNKPKIISLQVKIER